MTAATGRGKGVDARDPVSSSDAQVVCGRQAEGLDVEEISGTDDRITAHFVKVRKGRVAGGDVAVDVGENHDFHGLHFRRDFLASMSEFREGTLGDPKVRPPRKLRVGSLRTIDIWSNPLLLLLAVGLLAAEWTLRRCTGRA